MQKVRKAVIMAAGFGTRFLPFSKAVSKVMLPIIDKPTIQLIVEEAVESGIEEILIIVGINKESIISHFTKNEMLEKKLENKPEFLAMVKHASSFNIQFVEQKVINGTGGAMLLAEDFVAGEPVLLMFADDLMKGTTEPVSKQVIDAYNKTGKYVLAVQSVPKEWVTKYSSVEFTSRDGRVMEVSKIVEKPKLEDVKSTYSTLGRYVLLPDIFDYARMLKPTIGGEIFLTDAFDILAKENRVVSYDFDGKRYDTGNKLGYLKAVADFALADKEYAEEYASFLKEKLNKI